MAFLDRIFGEDPEKVRREQAAQLKPQFAPGQFNQDARAYSDPYMGSIGRMRQHAGGVQFRQGPTSQAAQIATGPQDQARSNQFDLVRALQATAAGQGPSAAQAQLNQATGRNISTAQALMQSQRGINPALAARQIGYQSAQINQDAAGQAATLRAQEALGAQSQLGQVLAGLRGQDLGLASSQAGFQQQTNLANQQAALEQRALNDRMTAFFEQAGLTREQAQYQAQILAEQMRQEAFQRQQGLAAAIEQSRIAGVGGLPGPGAGILQQVVGGAAGGLGSWLAMRATQSGGGGA